MPTLATSPRFFFRQRHGSIDWRKIANLDVDRIACEVDVDSLQELADNMWDQGLAIGPSYPRAPSYVSAAAQTLATTAAIAGG